MVGGNDNNIDNPSTSSNMTYNNFIVVIMVHD